MKGCYTDFSLKGMKIVLDHFVWTKVVFHNNADLFQSILCIKFKMVTSDPNQKKSVIQQAVDLYQPINYHCHQGSN